MSEERVRPGAEDIYASVKRDAAKELARPLGALAFSGLFAGGTLGFCGLAAAGAAAVLGHAASAELVGAVVYPVGFIAAIIGRAQLFTEATLYPVTLVLDERRHLRPMLRLWTVVWGANVVGALAFAFLAVHSGAVPPDIVHELTGLGRKLSVGSWSSKFWSGLVAGWLLALVAWTIEASDQTIGQIVLIWAFAFVIGLGSFEHCVSTTAEVLAAVVHGTVSIGHFFSWLAAVTLGNIVGGVAIVGMLDYGQVWAGED